MEEKNNRRSKKSCEKKVQNYTVRNIVKVQSGRDNGRMYRLDSTLSLQIEQVLSARNAICRTRPNVYLRAEVQPCLKT